MMVDPDGQMAERSLKTQRFFLEHYRPVGIVRNQIAGNHVASPQYSS
jgi:hypothetical protein